MNFKELQLSYGNEERIKEDPQDKKRYVVGVDLFNQEGPGVNVFTIFDKYNGRDNIAIRTKKNFNDFLEKLKAKTPSFNSEYTVSRKFINKDGSIKRREQITA